LQNAWGISKKEMFVKKGHIIIISMPERFHFVWLLSKKGPVKKENKKLKFCIEASILSMAGTRTEEFKKGKEQLEELVTVNLTTVT